MKRKQVITLILAASLTVSGMLAGCGSGTTATSSSASSTASSASSETEADSAVEASEADPETQAYEDKLNSIKVVDKEVSPEEAVKLGEYKGLKLTKTVQKVTDEAAKDYAESNAEIKEVEDKNATAAKDDYVNIDFAGKIDGKEFDGGTEESYDLQIGSGVFIEGFEDGIVGMKVGDEKDLNLKFPDDYFDENTAGKDVVFHVKLNKISQAVEVTDEDVANAKKELQAEYDSGAEAGVRNDAWQQVIDGSEITEISKADVDAAIADYKKELEDWVKSSDMKMEDYYEMQGTTEEDFNKDIEMYAKDITREKLIREALAKAEGISVEDKEQDEKIEEIAKDYQMEKDQLIEEYGEEEIKNYALTQRLIDRIVSYADVETVEANENADSEEFVSDATVD